jgi:hypothetical protein
MALFVRRSILINFSVVLLCLPLFLTSKALAQHPGARVGGAVPVPPAPIMHPPIYRAPVYQAPMYQPPIYRAPSYAPIAAPRLSLPYVHTSGILPVRPPGPIRPFPPRYSVYVLPVFTTPFWPFNYCWWKTCNQYWTSALIYNGANIGQWNPPNYVVAPPSETRVYVYGQERPDVPQLFLKDGTILSVTDYWVVDGQLHFMLIEEDGIKPVEQVIPFDELDLQKTIDVNTQRGFHFLLRNEPLEQYMRDHPDGPPAALSPQNP